jgi:hypothetical protein
MSMVLTYLEEIDLKRFDPKQIYQWARDNNIAHTPASFIMKYNAIDLLAMSEAEVRQLPECSKKKVSDRAADALWNALLKVNKVQKRLHRL